MTREGSAVVSAIIEAASVVLARGPHSEEVLVVRRSDSLRFFGGYMAFPGGKVAPEDAALLIRDNGSVLSDPRRVCCVRELFEETGVLLARRTDGSFPPQNDCINEARRSLLADQLPFAQFLENEELHLNAGDLIPVGSLVTPPFSPMRFDTAFFIARLPDGQSMDIWPGELSGGKWTSPGELLTEWEQGRSLLTPPTLTILQSIREGSALALPERMQPLLSRLTKGAIPPITFAPGIHMMPLKTVGLPPTTYTNAFLIGNEKRWLIDPGTHEAGEQQRLFDALDYLLDGTPLSGVVLTHQHPDHVGGVMAVVDRYRVHVFAHPLTAELLPAHIRVDRFLDEGNRLDLGTTPDGSRSWYVEALHTPGHAAGHLAFHDPYYRLLLAGDIVSTLSSVVLPPPDGDLIAYLETLHRIRSLDLRMLFPAHGGPTLRATKLIDDTLAHRRKREEELLAALAGHSTDVVSLAGRLYSGLPEPLRVLARMQVEAGLEKLRREGKARPEHGEDNAPWTVVQPATVG